MFKAIIKFNRKWKGKDDNMKGMYALDIDEKTYLMKYELATLKPIPKKPKKTKTTKTTKPRPIHHNDKIMKNYQEKILKALEGGDLTSEELVKRTGLLIGQIRNALSELKNKGMIYIKYYKNKKAVWAIGENEENRKTREIEEGAVFASEVMREAAKKAFLKRSYQ